jgi:succinylarginine dihydrolase
MSAPESRWRTLLDLALPALDHVFGAAADETRPRVDTLRRSVMLTASGDRILPHVFAIAREVLVSAAAARPGWAPTAPS